jgi:predicted nucleic acid-binding Zn ribbon protein
MTKNQSGSLVVEYNGITGTYKEIAKVLGVSYGNMRTRYSRRKKSIENAKLGMAKAARVGRPKKEKKPKVAVVSECRVCGTSFSNNRRAYCSKECSAIASKQRKYPTKRKPESSRVCVVCGNGFTVTGAAKHKTCSPECSNEHRRRLTLKWISDHKEEKALAVEKKRQERRLAKAEAAIAKREAMRLESMPERECVHCGKVFRSRKSSKNTCSDKCYKAVNRSKYKKKAKPKLEQVPIRLNCKCCGAAFESIYPDTLYCSKACRKKSDRSRNRVSDHHKARKAISGRLREVLKRKGLNKCNSAMKYVGLSTKDFFDLLESKFTDGMTWENYGVFGWHIDHIVPCAAFDLSREDHIYLCFDKANLRPLWHNENIGKAGGLVQCDIDALDCEFLERLVSGGVLMRTEQGWRVVSYASKSEESASM